MGPGQDIVPLTVYNGSTSIGLGLMFQDLLQAQCNDTPVGARLHGITENDEEADEEGASLLDDSGDL